MPHFDEKPNIAKQMGRVEFGKIQNVQNTTKAQLDLDKMIQDIQRKSDQRTSMTYGDLTLEVEEAQPTKDRQ